ncbi:MAG: gliding motility-associated C-terminal domain-containing protein [Saprospiraceae bacterium]|nr:gliding motility-associated C-terminal domain-containing protein [Saprospiraceae bacterium]
MKFLQLVQQCLFFLCLITTLVGQKRFGCNGDIFVMTNDGKTTAINQVSFAPFVPPSLSLYARYDGSFDALGFNPVDNYVYSVEQNTNMIVRHSLFGMTERIGSVLMVDTLRCNAGDCTADGFYVCYDHGLHKMLVFEVVDQFKLLRLIDLFWDPASINQGAFRTRIFDFAFDPNNPKVAYSYQGSFNHPELLPVETRGTMLKINMDLNDPNLGMVTPLGMIPTNEVTHLAGFVFDPRSTLYGFGAITSSLNPKQNKLWTISSGQGLTSPVLTHSPAQILSDGCSCPFSLVFTNTTPNEGMYCNNDQKTFLLSLENNSYQPIKDLVLKDTFPEGTIIQSITNNFTGAIAVGTGIGTNVLSISGLMIPPKAKVVIEVVIVSVDAKDGPAYNQAYLSNLPPRFPTILPSDDALSSTFGDRSNFFFITRSIGNLMWKITPPSDCVLANDGKIIASSPDLIPGQRYEVSLRNLKGWQERVSVVLIDESNSFTIDSLIPGEYQLFRFRSLLENCSVSLKDTTIFLDAPNDLFALTISSNSPVCEGDSILLSSIMSPVGQVTWRGPAIFGSEFANPIIENATINRAGNYTITAQYGYCTQKRNINVEVKPEISTKLQGADAYCERDTLRLVVIDEDKEAALNYVWSGPNDITQKDSIFVFPSVSVSQSGYYEVISNNGACYDTVGINIHVLPTPTLVLEDQILTDFCEPLVLLPLIEGGSDVTYQWAPSEGLSCADCLNPTVKLIVNSYYILKVENSYSCKDSATIQIKLDKKNIAFTPNIFSSKASAENSKFYIYPNCVVYYFHQIDIYDRFGNKVFTSKVSIPSGTIEVWDGLYLGKPVAQGVYVWVAKAELVDGSLVYLTGDITVL